MGKLRLRKASHLVGLTAAKSVWLWDAAKETWIAQRGIPNTPFSIPPPPPPHLPSQVQDTDPGDALTRGEKGAGQCKTLSPELGMLSWQIRNSLALMGELPGARSPII